MNLRSKKTQLAIFISYLFFSCLIAFIWLSSGYAVEKVVSFYNFMGKVDPSGFLIFAGVAAAVIYKSPSLNYFRDITFFTAFWFAIAQASVAAMDDMSLSSLLSPTQSFLISAMVIFGFGFVLFSVLAVVAYAIESKENAVAEEKKKCEENTVTNINLNPSLKNDPAQPFPAPSDLAHDLRYSRSRARRSRAQR